MPWKHESKAVSDMAGGAGSSRLQSQAWSRANKLEMGQRSILSKPALSDILPPGRSCLLSLPQTEPPTVGQGLKGLNLQGHFSFKPLHGGERGHWTSLLLYPV